MQHVPDPTLVRAFLDGDEQAFRALYRRHAGRLRAIVLRLLGGRRADADDVLQEAWLAACRAMPGFRGEAKFSTWLIAITIRVAGRRLSVPEPFDGELIEELPSPFGEGSTDGIDLERALTQISDAQRAVVVLHDVEGFTHEEIGSALGIATGDFSLGRCVRRPVRRQGLAAFGSRHAFGTAHSGKPGTHSGGPMVLNRLHGAVVAAPSFFPQSPTRSPLRARAVRARRSA